MIPGQPNVDSGVPTAALRPGGDLERFVIDVMKRNPHRGLTTEGKLAPGVGQIGRVIGNGPGSVSPSFTGPVEPYSSVATDRRLTLTPKRNCWWEVEFSELVVCLDAAWVRLDYYADLDGAADADGVTMGVHGAQPLHNALGVCSIYPKGLFKLLAGVTYVARPVLMPQSGTWQWWRSNNAVTAGHYQTSRGKIVGYW